VVAGDLVDWGSGDAPMPQRIEVAFVREWRPLRHHLRRHHAQGQNVQRPAPSRQPPLRSPLPARTRAEPPPPAVEAMVMPALAPEVEPVREPVAAGVADAASGLRPRRSRRRPPQQSWPSNGRRRRA